MRILSLLLPLLLAHGTCAQQVLWEKFGSLDLQRVPQHEILGGHMDAFGDYDADGYEDLITIRRGAHLGSFPQTTLLIISGKDGSTIRERTFPSRDTYGRMPEWVRSAGDFDGDGSDDYLWLLGTPVASPYGDAGYEIRSGRDDAVLWALYFSFPYTFKPYDCISNLNLDGDNRPDILLTLFSGSYPYFDFHYVGISNANRPLYFITQPPVMNPAAYFVSIGDIDNDRCDDYVGVTRVPSWGGGVAFFSGRTGTLLGRGYGNPLRGFSSMQIVPMGDLDRDGVMDIAYVVSGGDYIRFFSGRTFQPIGPDVDTYVRALSADVEGGVDVDLDGVPDVVACTDYLVDPYQGAPVQVFSGRDRQPIMSAIVRTTETGFVSEGYSLLFLKPPPGSRLPRLAVGNPGWSQVLTPTTGRYGRIRLIECKPPDGVYSAPGCVGSLPRIPDVGISSLGFRATRINLSSAPAAAPSVLLLGASSTSWGGWNLPLDLGLLGWHGCHLRTSIEATVPVTTGSMGLDRGYASVTLNVPPVARANASGPIHAQWLVFDPSSSQRPGLSAMQGFWVR